MSSILELVNMATRLDEIHRVMRDTYGANFLDRVDQWEPTIRKVAEQHDGNVTAAAIALTKDSKRDEREVLLIMAVAVELVQLDAAARRGGAA